MICLQTPSFGWSFQDGRQLAPKPAHHKQRVARSNPIFEISGAIKLEQQTVYNQNLDDKYRFVLKLVYFENF